MPQFQFRDNSLTLDIGGVTFQIQPDNPEYMGLFNENQKKLQTLSESVIQRGKQAVTPDIIEETCRGMMEAIDTVLGGHASERIFSGRAVSFFDLMDVLAFIKSEITKYWPDHLQIATQPQSRAQRRSK